MSFGRPGSGPNGLSINTTSANSSLNPPPTNSLFNGSTFGSTGGASGGLFGASSATSQPQATGGLFGSSTPSTQAQPSGGLFANQSTQQGGGLFGSQAGNSQQQQGGGLFGAQPTQQNTSQGSGLFGLATSQQQGGGIFNSTNAQQPRAQQSGGLFGASLGQNQNQGQNQQQQGGGLFGSLGNNQNKPSIFSTTSNQVQPTQPNQQQQPSLFSNLSNSTNTDAKQQASRPSLFGATTATSTTQQPSLFGTSMSGGLSMGQSTQQQQQQTVPGVRIDVANLRGTTRFGDLHEELQKQIEHIDNVIQGQIGLKEQVDSLMPGLETKLSYVPNDVEFVSRKLDTMHNALENDAEAIDYVRKIVKKDAANAKVSFRTIDNLGLPQSYQFASLWNTPQVFRSDGPKLPGEEAEEGSADLVGYFSTHAEALGKTLESYKQNMREIEAHLLGVEANTMQQMQQLMFTRGHDGGATNAEDQMRELVAVLREFESGILGVAGKVGGVREGVQDLAFAGQQGGRTGKGLGTY